MVQPAVADRLDAWRDLIRDSFVALDIVADHAEGFTGRVRSTDLGHLNLASVESGTQVVTRTPHLARLDAEVYLQVGLLNRGSALLQQDGREAVLAPGDFAVYETDRPFSWGLKGDWELLVFTWPRASVRLHATVSQALTARCIDGSGGLGAIVGRMLRDLVSAPPELSVDGGIRLGYDISELVTTVASERARPSEPERSSDSLVRRIDEYIAERLSDPNLGPSDIASAHFISTRHLHRLFAGRGRTVTQQIQHLRLERCQLELRHQGYDDRSITEIAWRWGFPDLATFSRAFRNAYGMTPTYCRSTRQQVTTGER
jgi:AraC-like DNA-binding protein